MIAEIRGASLVVTHGGHGSLLETLAAGPAALFYPRSPEQIGNAQRAVELGLGARVDASMPGDEVARTVERLMAEQEPRTSLRELLRSTDGATALAELGEQFVATQPS
ncbi:hypothetical protein ATY41_10035 [Leifsonia xyli subsp. xyli]|uniref:Glycosyl transferase family 28 C-terminal domain-containing protein n=1 Tax=Leifsonia xyli subsp. xyli TaxID=59736 RepID=A0A1E2SL29_LEIXY|nr:hypothetical protein ATY41_10035 [Leifsonia xyli subsp. xyli]